MSELGNEADGTRIQLGQVCEHGSLKRQCELCQVISERDALKAELENADKVIDELRAQNLRIAQEAVDFKTNRDAKAKECERLRGVGENQ